MSITPNIDNYQFSTSGSSSSPLCELERLRKEWDSELNAINQEAENPRNWQSVESTQPVLSSSSDYYPASEKNERTYYESSTGFDNKNKEMDTRQQELSRKERELFRDAQRIRVESERLAFVRKKAIETARFDDSHSRKDGDVQYVPRSDKPLSELFGWFLVSVGLVGVIIGSLFYLKGMTLEAIIFPFMYGMPIALIGSLFVICGLVVQVRRLAALRREEKETLNEAEKSKYVSKQLEELRKRMEELRLVLAEE